MGLSPKPGPGQSPRVRAIAVDSTDQAPGPACAGRAAKAEHATAAMTMDLYGHMVDANL
jgi:hypothetical protein